MFGKKHIGNRLYDFLSGAVLEDERLTIEKHLASCQQCSEERAKIEQALKLLNAEKTELPDLPERYWVDYWKTLESRLKTSPIASSRIQELVELLKSRQRQGLLSPKIAYGVIGFALGAVIMFGILSPYLGRKNQGEVITTTGEQREVQPQVTETAAVSSAAAEITEPLIQFFQKAKAFLIGVKNTDESKETPGDLITEQETSKRLSAECRNLKRQSLDPRVQQLLSELDVVLVQLSKVKDESDSLKFDLVKEGIEKNNLVMKIRVHELAQEVRLLQASQREQN